MTKQELLDKAIYIQYPLKYGEYKKFDIEDIYKLPLPEKGEMYDNWEKNNNHFTTKYHRKCSIPLYCEIFGLNYNPDDFVLCERKSGNNDISILVPKKEYRYEIYGFSRDEHFDNLSFDGITHTHIVNMTDYHKLYKYPHECSRLINKAIDNNRKLFISGDSQMIPDISFLSCFFKEIWYFDNRLGRKLSDKWKDVDFTDVMIEMNCGDITTYKDTNLL